MKGILASSVAALLLGAAIPAFTQPPKKAPVKPPAIGTLGTDQMKGGDGQFGRTYTLTDSGGGIYNVTITGAEYTVARYNVNVNRTLAPRADEKLLILHLLVQNPKPNDEYFGGSFITFSTVAKDDKTRNHNEYLRLASTKEELRTTLKPGQKFPEEILACCVIPANGPVPKLIVNRGRKGTSEKVMRFPLGKAPNTIKPLAAPYADPSDSTGATALEEIPAQVGTTYSSGFFDLTVTGFSYAPGPIGDVKAAKGKRFLVANVSLTNKTWHKIYVNPALGVLAPALLTDDDEKTTNFIAVKGKRDEKLEGRQIDPDESVNARLLFAIPDNAKGKKLKLAEVLTNSSVMGRAFTFDLSGVQ